MVVESVSKVPEMSSKSIQRLSMHVLDTGDKH
jgi:recombinational DNA repair protein RecR